MAGHVFQVGGPTMGIAAKLANNLMLFVSLLGVAEGTQLAARLGLDPETFFKVASVSSGDSWPLRTWYPVPGVVPTSPANRNFDATFTTQLADRDLAFAVAAGEQAGLNMPAARLALQEFDQLIDEGYTVRVIRLRDGSHQLAIENLDTTNGPDLPVWLSAGPVVEGFDGWFTAGGHTRTSISG